MIEQNLKTNLMNLNDLLQQVVILNVPPKEKGFTESAIELWMKKDPKTVTFGDCLTFARLNNPSKKIRKVALYRRVVIVVKNIFEETDYEYSKVFNTLL